jgi:uncharacterized membrane protein YuzA (DUF378 family)
MTAANKTALVLVILGALNWLTVGWLHFDLAATAFGVNTLPTRLIYVIIGVAGLLCIPMLFARRLGPSIKTEEENARLHKAA